MVKNNSELIKQSAKQWVKDNKKKLIAKYCDAMQTPQDTKPVTIFMAGTPGAGKTEFSKTLIKSFDTHFVRIDADDIREMMREVGYTGANSHLFQDAANKAVNILFDYANKKGGHNVLLDGTFAYSNWRKNIQRSLAHGRLVEIYYLYQDPILAWDFVKKRELTEGRTVPLKVFTESYAKSIANVQKAIEIFGEEIGVYFAKNNYKKSVEYIRAGVEDIEELLPNRYNKIQLTKEIHARETS